MTSFNSVTGHIDYGREQTGVYDFNFSGVATPPRLLLATAVGRLGVRCRPQNYDLSLARLQAGCNRADGSLSDEQASVMWFTRGRVGHRYGFTSPLGPTVTSSPNDPLFTSSSSGGAITSRRIATGQWTVTFAGLGRPAGATDIVILSAFVGPDHSCSTVSWANSGATDLTVTVQCFDAAGAPFDGRFSFLVLE